MMPRAHISAAGSELMCCLLCHSGGKYLSVPASIHSQVLFLQYPEIPKSTTLIFLSEGSSESLFENSTFCNFRSQWMIPLL